MHFNKSVIEREKNKMLNLDKIKVMYNIKRISKTAKKVLITFHKEVEKEDASCSATKLSLGEYCYRYFLGNSQKALKYFVEVDIKNFNIVDRKYTETTIIAYLLLYAEICDVLGEIWTNTKEKD